MKLLTILVTVLFLLSSCRNSIVETAQPNPRNTKIVIKPLPNLQHTVSVIDVRKSYSQIKPIHSYFSYSDSDFSKPLPEILREQLESKQAASDKPMTIKLNTFLVSLQKTGTDRVQRIQGAHDVILNTILGTIPAAIVSIAFDKMDIGTTQHYEQVDISCTVYIESENIPILLTYENRVDVKAVNINIPLTIKKCISNLSDELHKIYRE